MSHSIAIVGMACRYPDARSPAELWENVLAQRRAFRRMPPERLRLEDYFSTDRTAADSIYSTEAVLIEGYEFDRVRFCVAGSTFRSADLAHWLALDVASQALDDGGFNGQGLPREMTGVFLGNTLTGEFSRANSLRLRWPYVRRILEASLAELNLPPEQRRSFLATVEDTYKAPFPPIGEESLAGNLSNTIAGRICNHFDLKGGGYTVDGACASSLLALAHACSALVAGDLDLALAGGVDLSMDPFELVGFAKVGALADEMMRVYDARSNGFWPGEGCGIMLLMRHEDALAQRRRVYATIEGWGISSDGSGGITRPEVEGQRLALERAYRRAGFGIETVAYFEGHGTGTSVGDATELSALSSVRRQAGRNVPPAAISSVKANIGHTKAAAGVAGVIKATMALSAGILPPTTGCEEPHPELSGESPMLRVLKQGQGWPLNQHPRAGVSSMGFGGINAHLVLEGRSPSNGRSFSSRERAQLSSAQDAELLLLGAQSVEELLHQVDHLLTFAGRISRAELSDLAAHLESTLVGRQVRAAIVAASPAELACRLESLKSIITSHASRTIDTQADVFFSTGTAEPRLGFLFPGQGSPSHLDGGALRRRFEFVRELYDSAPPDAGENETATEVAQPAIVNASMAALRVLSRFDITAQVAIGHSLGELTALGWAGVLDEEVLLRIAGVRGRAMSKMNGAAGAMASIAAGRREVESLLNGDPVVIAGVNGPLQTVLSGEAVAVSGVVARARAMNLHATQLPVSHAFHSPLVAAAAPALAAHLAGEKFKPLQRSVVSTITGELLAPQTDLRALLQRQITSPVLFMDAATVANAGGVDLWIEVGPGSVLRGLMTQLTNAPVISVDAGGPSLRGTLRALGAAYALGQPVNHQALFDGRFTRPFALDWHPKFFVNPCELAPVSETMAQSAEQPLREEAAEVPQLAPPPSRDASALDMVVQLVSERAELPPSAVKNDSKLLSDLHLNSISVGQLVAEAARRLGLPRPVSPTDYADATVSEIAQALDELLRADSATPTVETEMLPAGVDSWARAFTVELVERSLPAPREAPRLAGSWQVLASPGYPLTGALQEALAGVGTGDGVMVCLPPAPDESHVGLLLESARAALALKEGAGFLLVQHGGGAAAFARTLHLEARQLTTCVVDVPPEHPAAVSWIVAEALAAHGYTEAHYDSQGRRRETVIRALPLTNGDAGLPLSERDVLVVTGGGKGITAECAFELAKETGARLALIGLAQPETDAELANNIKRLVNAGIKFKYIAADVTDAAAIREAIREFEAELGPVTGLLHGAARNVPQSLSDLEEKDFQRTLAIKVQGARNLLAAVAPERLRLFVTFGSIIARSGLPGEADYGLANEWLTRLAEQWQSEHPACRCVAVEWSIWSGVGMGARLGRLDLLAKQGITPITPEQGVALLRQLLSQSLPAVPVIVMGRFTDMPTFEVERPELPLLRFLEQPRIYYPNVELVVEVQLSTGTDPYLNDHQLQGERLLPAVMGLEAMAQVAMALTGATMPPVFQKVNFKRPVVVPENAPLTIRIVALVRAAGLVEIALRSAETAFQLDHFQAVCRFDNPPPEKSELSNLLFDKEVLEQRVALDPACELYGSILFQRGRFQRLQRYHLLKATECMAEIASDDMASWFSQYLPGTLVLGDPGLRDAAIHAVQACIPQTTLIPIGVERITLSATHSLEPLYVRARERAREGNIFTYELCVWGADGCLREHWEGLRLRAVNGALFQGEWAEALLAPYVERTVRELIPDSAVSVALERNAGMERHAQSTRAIQLALGEKATVVRRSDGKPEVAGGSAVSAAHVGDLTLAIAGQAPLGCDIEQVLERPAHVWLELLGENRATLAQIIARQAHDDAEAAATRVWAASECLKKAGAVFDAPLLFVSARADGWVVLSSGLLMIATYVAQVRQHQSRLVIAVLVESRHACL